MVWAGVTADRRSNLVIVPAILTGQAFLRQMDNNGIFQDDNESTYRARIVDG